MTKKPNLTLWDHIPFKKSTPSPDLKFELRKLQIENENLRDKIESVVDQGKEKDYEIFALTCQLSEINNLFFSAFFILCSLKSTLNQMRSGCSYSIW